MHTVACQALKEFSPPSTALCKEGTSTLMGFQLSALSAGSSGTGFQRDNLSSKALALLVSSSPRRVCQHIANSPPSKPLKIKIFCSKKLCLYLRTLHQSTELACHVKQGLIVLRGFNCHLVLHPHHGEIRINNTFCSHMYT